MTDRVTVRQIWEALGPVHRQTLLARAESASPAEAAGRLGISVRLYHYRIGRARRRFRELWHEGEAPSETWRHDRTVAETTASPASITRRAFTPSRRAQAAGAPAKPAALRPRKDIGISGEELLRRHLAGESLRQREAAIGASRSTITKRMREAGYVPYASANARSGPPPKDIGVTDHELLERYRAGQFRRALAEEFGISTTTVYWRLRKTGHVPHSPPSGQQAQSRSSAPRLECTSHGSSA